MIVSRTPFRVSFFGGGTDCPAWYSKNGGAVLATSIDKYCYISCRKLPPFFPHKHRIVYSIIESVTNNKEIKHPVVREIFEWMRVSEGLEVHHDGDIPARSGLGSSSSFTVGLLNALYANLGSIVSKERLAKEATFVEQELVGDYVGCQDQIAASYGGFNRIEFRKSGSFVVEPIIISDEKKSSLQDHCLLIFTGISRIASTIAQTKIQNFSKRERQLLLIREMVNEGLNILQSKTEEISNFGKLMHEAWQLKKTLAPQVSSGVIDEMYDKAQKLGAYGGKLLGAGGGGFLLIMCPPEKKRKICEEFSNYVNVPFKFEDSGSRIILYQPVGF